VLRIHSLEYGAVPVSGAQLLLRRERTCRSAVCAFPPPHICGDGNFSSLEQRAEVLRTRFYEPVGLTKSGLGGEQMESNQRLMYT
jgi:hypothetical protein